MRCQGADSGWFKSSRSTSGNETCVEVRIIAESTVGVRDSKDQEAGAFWVPPVAWASFIGQVKAGAYDLPN
ncbi:DUF397 domain-containing protein [Saccharopolyspora sp. 5N708]|uniref:DUF397 domain-containing protein n=1 Tax=Saccharopolyspora sp. 5N708 TaxID=3457424 RepID=UPI003FD4FA45